VNETPRDRDEADAADEELEARDEIPSDEPVPEADALEQAADVVPTNDEEPAEVGDRPEADALEQARAAGGDDEVDERR
jgi:hypothetical protein